MEMLLEELMGKQQVIHGGEDSGAGGLGLT